jgi:putative membrane protein
MREDTDEEAGQVNRTELIIAVCLSIFFLVGFVGHSFEITLPWMLRLTPSTLVICGLMALLPVLLEGNKGLILWGLILFVSTFFLEALGTATGKIFGPYTYGRTLGLKLLDVPLVIAFNWFLVILGSLSLAQLLLRRKLLPAILTAALAVGFDFLLEPTAIRLDYWTWHTPDIPLQNYVAWSLIALVAALFFVYFKLSVKTRLPVVYFLIQLVFFAALRIFPPLV